MTRIALILALAIALPAWAQADKPTDKAAATPAAEKPTEKPAAQPDEKTEAAKAEAPKKRVRKHSRRMEDARHCLDEPTNTAIIKCAEAYL